MPAPRAAKDVLSRLEKTGTEQKRKIFRRHGVSGEHYGVSFAELRRMAKQIKTDHPLALSLWESGSHDARALATMIADPSMLDKRTIRSWSRALSNYVLTDLFSTLCAQSPHARELMEEWTASESEWIGAAGWNILAHLAMKAEDIPDGDFRESISQIEHRIHSAKNRARHSMNMALIAIGLRSAALRKDALAAARRIGHVEVEHGETGCVTPDAASYIRKAVKYRQSKSRATRKESR